MYLKRTDMVVISMLFAFLSRGDMTTCSEDVCVNGFCGYEVGQPVCSCTLGWTGDSCEVIDEAYAAVECVNGFVGIIDEDFVCSCDSGWQGDSCSDKILDYHTCSNIECNNKGDCMLSSQSEPYCSCFDGYSGDQCEHEDTMCGEEYLLNVASSVFDEDWNAGLDCSFFIGLLWSDMSSNGVTGYPGLCTCLDMLTGNMADWSESLGCVIEENFPLSILSMNTLHCNNCTDDDMNNMKAAIQNYSVTCDMFITYRDEMPLYWRTPLKCVCLDSLGTREEASEWVYCPFTDHAARTDMVAYDNCNDESVEICDFTYMKHQIETNLKTRNPAAYETCTSAMIDLMDMLPTEVGFFIKLPGDWCPCYEAIAEFWSDGLDVLDCHAVTFYEFTVKDLFLLYCNDETFENKDDLWSVAKVAIAASANDYKTAATCQNFVVYGSALSDNATESSLLRAKTLLCDCMEGLQNVVETEDLHVLGITVDWPHFNPTQLADGIIYMQELLELFPSALADLSISDCEFVTEDSIFINEVFESGISRAEAKVKSAAGVDTRVKGETLAVDYTKINVSLGMLCTCLFLIDLFMYRYRSSNDKGRKMPSVMIL